MRIISSHRVTIANNPFAPHFFAPTFIPAIFLPPHFFAYCSNAA